MREAKRGTAGRPLNFFQQAIMNQASGLTAVTALGAKGREKKEERMQ